MKADIGDRVIVNATRPGAARRDGEIVALHHPDGSPPWDVRWSETGRVSMFFPGPDTQLHHFEHHGQDWRAAGVFHTFTD
ncbi:DUF1918 domain-containing protein [Kitasatospora sp. NPDC085879]|uniref:DUF1918 domain-containing protein n=1 Tax=Kitasatospora sp. NPDC085879 TaxID=3154769 RepID=UPI0034189CE9